jgi:hypothetical protein
MFLENNAAGKNKALWEIGVNGIAATVNTHQSPSFLFLYQTQNVSYVIKKVKLSHYMPWRHMGGEEV